MPVTVQWDTDSTQPVLVFVFDGDWTWHECREVMQYAEFMSEDTPGDLNFIYDLTPNRLPQRVYLPIMQKLLVVKLTRDPVKIVVVERGHFVETIKEMLATSLPDMDFAHIMFAESIARARALVAR